MCDFLAQANAITYLDLSSTDCSVELVSQASYICDSTSELATLQAKCVFCA